MIRMLTGYIRNSFNSLCTSVQNSECKCICLGYSQGAEHLGSKVRQLWLNLHFIILIKGLPLQLSGKQSTCQCRSRRRHGFNTWVGKIHWRRKWQPTPVFLAWRILQTEEPVGLQIMGSQRVRHDLASNTREMTSLRVMVSLGIGTQ